MLTYRDQLIDAYKVLHGEPDPDLHCQYSISFFSKVNFRENDIFTVQMSLNGSKKRIGWIFPVFVLGSSEFNLYDDEHLRKYLKVGGSHISSAKNLDPLDDNSHMLILKDERLITEEVYDSYFTISLLKWGYYPISAGLNICNSLCVIDNSAVKKIDLQKCAAISSYTPYIRKLFLELLPKVTDPLSRFISIYQTVEILMEKYFHQKIDELRVKRSTIGTIRDNVSDLSSERKLINGLFEYCSLRVQLNNEEKDLVRRLFFNDKDENYYKTLKLPSFIYDIRNAIVHNYHKYELSVLMMDISERMELIWVEMLENKKASDLLMLN